MYGFVAIAMMFPASAGMNRGHLKRTGDVFDVPRERGDEPIFENEKRENIVCSPRARG